jgi:hypothetical protein
MPPVKVFRDHVAHDYLHQPFLEQRIVIVTAKGIVGGGYCESRLSARGTYVSGVMNFQFYGDELRMQFEALVADPWDSWLGCVMPFRIIGPASNVKSMIGSISLHQGRGSVGNGGGSFAHMKTFACASFICRLADTDFDQDTPTD